MSKKGQHKFIGRVGKKHPLPWVFCVKCGLLRLNNEASRKAEKKPCDSDLDDE